MIRDRKTCVAVPAAGEQIFSPGIPRKIHAAVRLVFLCALSALLSGITLPAARADGGTWKTVITYKGSAGGSTPYGTDPNNYYSGSYFNDLDVPTTDVGITDGVTYIYGNGLISCESSPGVSNYSTGYGNSQVTVTITWQPKNNDPVLDPAPAYVLFGYKCTASVTENTYVTLDGGQDGYSGYASAEAGASVDFGDISISIPQSSSFENYAPPNGIAQDEDPLGLTLTDPNYIYALLPVQDGQATFQMNAVWSASANTEFPDDPDQGGSTAEATFGYRLDVVIAGLDAGRSNGRFGSWFDGIKNFFGADPSFTRWLPLSFAPNIDSQPLLVSDPNDLVPMEKLPLFWGNLNCAYSIAIHPEVNPDHNATGNYYQPPQAGSQLIEDTQANVGGYVITDANGDRLTLDKYFAPSPDILSTFAQTGTGFTLSNAGPPGHIRERGNYTYTFEAYSSATLTARLLSISDDLGNAQNVVYGNGAANLPYATVTDASSNRQLFFYTQGDYVSEVVAPVLFGSTPVTTTLLTNDGSGHYTDIAVYNGSDVTFSNPITETKYAYNDNSPGIITQGLSSETLYYVNSPAVDVASNVIPRVSRVVVGKVDDPTNAPQSVTQYQYGTINQGYGFYGVDSRTNSITDPRGNSTQIIYSYVNPVLDSDPEAIAGVQTTTPTYSGASGPGVWQESWAPDQSHPTGYQITDPLLRTWVTQFDAVTGLPTEFTDPENHSYQLSYSGTDLQSVTDPTAIQWSFSYDPLHPNDGLLTSVTDNGQNVLLTATYNQFGQLQTETTPGSVSASGQNETSTWTYDESSQTGDLLVSTDPRGAQWMAGKISSATHAPVPGSAYDSLGDPLAFSVFPDTGNPQTAAQSLVTQFTWTPDQQVQTATLPNGAMLSHSYANGIKTQTQTLDPFGNLLAQSSVLFDTHGRAYQASDLLGVTAHISLDPSNNVVNVQDGRGVSLSASYGPNNEVTSTSGPFGYHVFGYSAAGELSQLTDSRQNLFGYSYDRAGRLQTVTVANQPLETLTYSYDNAGRLLSVVKANGDSVAFTYAAPNNWLASVATTAGARQHTVNYTYYGDGKLRQAASVTSTGHSYLTGYEWDAAGNLIGMDLPGGDHTAWSYDYAGRVTGQLTSTGSAQIGTQFHYGTSGMTSDPSTAPAYLSQIIDTVNSAPVETYSLTHSYLDQLLGYSATGSDGSSSSASYSYDARGRLVSESRQGIAGGQSYTGGANYSYDASNNLNAGANGWQYDSSNRLVSAPSLPNSAPGAEQVTYDADGHPTTIVTPLTFDSSGNVTSTDTKTITYTVWGQVATVVDNGASSYTATYLYDPLGRRSSEAVDNGSTSVTTSYDYDGYTLIGEEVVTVTSISFPISGPPGIPIPASLDKKHSREQSLRPTSKAVPSSSVLAESPLQLGSGESSSFTAASDFLPDIDLALRSPIDQIRHAARDNLGGDEDPDSGQSDAGFEVANCTSNESSFALDTIADSASTLTVAASFTTVGFDETPLVSLILRQQIGQIPGVYTTFSSGPNGYFGQATLSANGQRLYSYYGAGGMLAAVYDQNGNAVWTASQGADALGNVYANGGLTPPPPPSPFVTNTSLQDATGQWSNASNGLNTQYNPATGSDLDNDSGDAFLNGESPSYGAYLKSALGLGSGNLLKSPAFQPGSEGRRFFANAMRMVPGAGQAYAADAAITGYDPIAGECEGLGARTFDGLQAADSVLELLPNFRTSNRNGATEIHHYLPQKFREYFARQGLDIADYTGPLERDFHQNYIHGEPDLNGQYRNTGNGGWWNREWGKWIYENPDASIDEIHNQLYDMMDRAGLSSHYNSLQGIKGYLPPQ